MLNKIQDKDFKIFILPEGIYINNETYNDYYIYPEKVVESVKKIE